MLHVKLDIQRFAAGLTISAYESNYDVSSNTSTVVVTATISRTSGSTYWEHPYERTLTITCGSQTDTWSTELKQNKTSATYTSTFYSVPHNNDGTGSVSYSGSIPKNSSFPALSASGTLTLTTIPRASTPTKSGDPTTGNTITIWTNRASSSFTHTIEYYFGNRSGTIATGVGDSCTWTPGHELCDQIPASTSGTGTIRCHTYSGGSHIGSKDIGFTLYANGSLVPSVSSASLSEGNSQVSSLGWGVHIKTKSYPTVACSASGIQGSWITKYILEYYTGNTYVKNLEGSSLQDLNTKLVNNFDKNNQYTYKIKVQDSRGRSGYSSSLTFTMLDYVAPTISATYSADRCDDQGTLQDDGTYLKCQFSGAISAVGGHNPITIKIGKKLKSASDYTYTTYENASILINSFDYTGANYKLLSGADDDKTYDIIFIVSDQFTTVYRTLVVSTAFVLMDFNPSGHGIAFGKSSEGNNFEVNMNADFKKTLSIDGHNIFDLMYPIGSVYTSGVNTNPAAYFGGTWVQLKGRYLYATNNNENTGAACGKDNMSTITGTATQGASGSTASTTLTANQSGLRWHDHSFSGTEHKIQARCAGGNGTAQSVSSYYNTWISGNSGDWWGNALSMQSKGHNTDVIGWTDGGTVNGNGGWNAAEGHTHGLNNHAHEVPRIEVYAWQRTA